MYIISLPPSLIVKERCEESIREQYTAFYLGWSWTHLCFFHQSIDYMRRTHLYRWALNPPKTNAVVPSTKSSSFWGRHAGGYFERSTRSSAMALIQLFKERQQYTWSLMLLNGIFLTEFQECDVTCMRWKVLVDNNLADPDMFPNLRRANRRSVNSHQPPSLDIFPPIVESEDDR